METYIMNESESGMQWCIGVLRELEILDTMAGKGWYEGIDISGGKEWPDEALVDSIVGHIRRFILNGRKIDDQMHQLPLDEMVSPDMKVYYRSFVKYLVALCHIINAWPADRKHLEVYVNDHTATQWKEYMDIVRMIREKGFPVPKPFEIQILRPDECGLGRTTSRFWHSMNPDEVVFSPPIETPRGFISAPDSDSDSDSDSDGMPPLAGPHGTISEDDKLIVSYNLPDTGHSFQNDTHTFDLPTTTPRI